MKTNVSLTVVNQLLKGSQGRNPKAKPETMEEYCLPAYFLWLCSEPIFLYNTGLLPRGDDTHSKLGPPISIINQDNTQQANQPVNLTKSFLY